MVISTFQVEDYTVNVISKEANTYGYEVRDEDNRIITSVYGSYYGDKGLIKAESDGRRVAIEFAMADDEDIDL